MKILLDKSYLFIAGLLMMLVGIYIAITTIDYVAAMTGYSSATSNNMLSDLRGMGGMLVIFGTYVLISTFRQGWRQTALMIATAIYASFVLFRTLGFILDGLPEAGILIAYSIELIMTVLGLGIIWAKGLQAPPQES